MNTWLQRLLVRGPTDEVKAFCKAAGSKEKTHYVNERAWLRTQRLSFTKLYKALPPDISKAVNVEIDGMQDPFDLSIDPIKRHRDGTTAVTYRFQLSAMEPENFITVLSEFYPRLCFVVGMVDPNSNEASSILAYRGKASQWRLPNRRIEAIYPRSPDEGDFWDYVESDWKAMDEVMDHWKAKVGKLMQRPSTSSSPAKLRRPTPGARRRRGKASAR